MVGVHRVWIDRDECIMCGLCWSVCPDFFEQSPDDDHSQVVAQYRTGDKVGEGQSPAELESCVKDAEEGCPVEIIHVES